MTENAIRNDLTRYLAVFGADFSRWPTQLVGRARAALLADPAFRRAWEAERDLDAALAAYRDSAEQELQRSGAAERIAQRALARLPSAGLGVSWQKVAAAMVLAGMLGGTVDFVIAGQATETADFASLDPLFALDDTALQ